MPGSGAAKVLTVLSSGGNQRYIFATNRRRQNVGASYLLAQTPGWVREALRTVGHSESDAVVNASGTAYLLLPDVSTARAVITAVTLRAIDEAPGLELYGWHEPNASDGHLKERVRAALRHLEQRRAILPPVLLRHPGTPFSAVCAFSTGAASAEPITVPVSTESGTTERRAHYCSPPVRAALIVANDALGELSRAHGSKAAGAIPTDGTVDDELGEDSWLAVVHADGNGFGQMLANLDIPDTAEYAARFKALSQTLDSIAHESLAAAIATVHETYLSEHSSRAESQKKAPPWILPLVVGGDDLTAMVAGRWARRFTEAYLAEFRDRCTKDTDTAGLSASAGIAVVKSGYPFYDAYELAEDLTKIAKKSGRDAGSYDLQVVHDSSGGDLDTVRSAVPVLPVRVTDSATGAPDNAPDGAVRVPLNGLKESLALLPAAFSRSVRHRVRDALVSGELDDVAASVVARLVTSTKKSEREQAQKAADWFTRYARTCGLLTIDLLDLEGNA